MSDLARDTARDVPRVSVVVPAHQAACTIERTLRSVQAQTYADWQVVVADDASTDGTPAVVTGLGDPRVHVVRLPRNAGPAAARNAALGLVRSELVAFLDADDWWSPSYLERMVAGYDEASQQAVVGLVTCDARVAEEDGTLTDQTYLAGLGRWARSPVTVDSLLRRNSVYISAVVPRTVGEQVGWFDERLFGTEDHDLWLKIAELGHRIVELSEDLAVYRRTAGSISRNTARQARNNQLTLRAALGRGRLDRAQIRTARAELRYNRALEVIAAAAFDRRRPALRDLPGVAAVAVSRPRQWGEWLRALRS